MTVHRVEYCRCGHEMHEGPCPTCTCPKGHKRGSPVRHEEGRLNSDMLNEMRTVARTIEIAALTLHRQAKAIGVALARQAPRDRGRALSPSPARRTPGESALGEGAHLANLGRCERALLHVLSERRGLTTSREQLAVMAGYSVESGGFANALGRLRTLELITRGWPVGLSPAVLGSS